MKDADIIKALECCFKKGLLDDECDECPNLAMGAYCMDRMVKDALDLINRQKSEIERLKDLNNVLETDIINTNMNLEHIQYEFDLLEQEKSVVRAEAITEFAERLKEYLDDFYNSNEDALLDTVGMIDQIAKEMKEGVTDTNAGCKEKGEQQ